MSSYCWLRRSALPRPFSHSPLLAVWSQLLPSVYSCTSCTSWEQIQCSDTVGRWVFWSADCHNPQKIGGGNVELGARRGGGREEARSPILAAVKCWVSWNRHVKLSLKLPLFPQFFVSSVLFLCWDTLCEGLVFFSFLDNKSHKICDRKLAGRRVLANPAFKVSLFLSKISV